MKSTRVFLGCVAVVAVAAVVSAAEPRVPARSGPAGQIAPPPAVKGGQVILYDQFDNIGANATSSQNFEAAFDAFDDELADDFVVPAGQTWSVEQINVDGIYFNGPGPATTVNVNFYALNGTLPADTPLAGGTYSNVTVGGSASGDFTIPLVPGMSLPPGTYFISVVANMNFTPNGQWGWTDRTVQGNNPAAWRNPGGGFGVCPTWGAKVTTCAIGTDPDQVWQILGVIVPVDLQQFTIED